MRIVYNYATMRKFISITFLVVLLALIPSLKPQFDVKASSVSASALIDWMNSLRVANGYSAMVRDSLLDSSAASAAYAMAASGCGHPGGKMERIAATGYGGGATFFATENIACATSADLSWFAQYNVWGDPIHQLPATDAQYTHVGAFAYTASDGVTYYVMHAASDPAGSSSRPSSNASANTPVPTVQLVEPVVTATPQDDGSIVHTVKYGQTLYTIAVWYGVTIDQIKTLNALTSNNIYEGQTLIIRQAPSMTMTPTVTATIQRPTRTPTHTKIPTTPAPTFTPSPTPKPGFMESLPRIDRQWLGLGLLVISAVGFFIVLVINFLKPLRKK